MNVSIGEPRRIGAFVVAPLARVRELSGGVGRTAWVQVELTVTAVAVRHQGQVRILSIDGREQNPSLFADVWRKLVDVLEQPVSS